MFNKIRAALGRSNAGAASSFAWLVVGLGNPNPEHAQNRHNVGFMAADRIAEDFEFGAWNKKFNALVADGKIEDARVLLIKPQTYMNRSGQAVAEAARFYKIPPEKIIVMHDELDLPLNKVRVKTGGGAAGHNGLKSIDESLGNPNYVRVRIGIGHPGDRARVTGHVLSDFDENDRHHADLMLACVSRHFYLLLDGRQADFMTKISEELKVN